MPSGFPAPNRSNYQNATPQKESAAWESTAVRWAAQLAVGALPGVILLLGLFHSAQRLHSPTAQLSAASVVPLLSANHLGDSSTFRKRDITLPVATAAVRTPSAKPKPTESKRMLHVVKRVSPLKVDMTQPRTEWIHLLAGQRHAIEQGLTQHQNWHRCVLHGSKMSFSSSSLLARYHEKVLGLDAGMAYHFVIANGQGEKDGQITVAERWCKGLTAGDLAEHELRDGSISICLLGDFQQAAPTTAQLEALDELVDYLRIKIGSLKVMTHHALSGGSARCMGEKFPEEQVIQGLALDY